MRRLLPFVITALSLAAPAVLAETEEEELARMQKQLNTETLSQPFLAEQPDKVDAYIKNAMKKNIKPEEYRGTHWQQGYTCRDLLRYSWVEYRNCMHYHRYHGRYYPYP